MAKPDRLKSIDNKIKRAKEYAATASAILGVYQSAKWAYTNWQDRDAFKDSYTLEIDPYNERVAQVVAVWVSRNIDHDEQRAFSVSNSKEFILGLPEDMEEKLHVKDGPVEATVWMKKEETPPGILRNESSPNINVSVKNKEDIEYLRESWAKISKELYEDKAKEPVYYVCDFGPRGKDLLKPLTRTVDTVHLAEGQMEDIISDLQRFYDSQDRYMELGIPYHRGYLLYGPPGTGKSSLAAVLAKKCKRNLCTMSLSSLTDNTISTIMGNLGREDILLLEDIDSFNVATERHDGKNGLAGLSTSSLLNALDGVGTPDGLVVIMTTNHKESLEPALIRPGRIDRVFHIGLCTGYQVNNYIKAATGYDAGYDSDVHFGFTMAELSEVMRQNLDNDSNVAYDALVSFVQSH